MILIVVLAKELVRQLVGSEIRTIEIDAGLVSGGRGTPPPVELVLLVIVSVLLLMSVPLAVSLKV